MNRNSDERLPIMKERDSIRVSKHVVLFKGLFIVFKEMFEKSDNATREHIQLASPSCQPIICCNVRWSEICVAVDAAMCILETTLKNST